MSDPPDPRREENMDKLWIADSPVPGGDNLVLGVGEAQRVLTPEEALEVAAELMFRVRTITERRTTALLAELTKEINHATEGPASS
mgnify:CR=1 FL=1